MLLRGGFIPAVIEPEQRSQYMSTLHAADLGDLLPFTLFMGQTLVATQQSLIEQKTFARGH
jgi:hypothetical protein